MAVDQHVNYRDAVAAPKAESDPNRLHRDFVETRNRQQHAQDQRPNHDAHDQNDRRLKQRRELLDRLPPASGGNSPVFGIGPANPSPRFTPCCTAASVPVARTNLAVSPFRSAIPNIQADLVVSLASSAFSVSRGALNTLGTCFSSLCNF
jgi:hypothetical protein